MLDKLRNFHFIGIGGAGMSAIAHVLIKRGYNVSGSDLNAGRVSARLASEGAMVFMGHDACQVSDADAEAVVVVVSAPEVVMVAEADSEGATVEEGVAAAKAAGADIIVLCSSDDEYAEYAIPAFKAIDGKAMFIVAGNPACAEDLKAAGIENFIHVRCNVLETLKEYNATLGIK